MFLVSKVGQKSYRTEQMLIVNKIKIIYTEQKKKVST